MRTIQSTYGKPVMQVEYGGPLNKPTQVRDSLKAFITGLRGIAPPPPSTASWKHAGRPLVSRPWSRP